MASPAHLLPYWVFDTSCSFLRCLCNNSCCAFLCLGGYKCQAFLSVRERCQLGQLSGGARFSNKRPIVLYILYTHFFDSFADFFISLEISIISGAASRVVFSFDPSGRLPSPDHSCSIKANALTSPPQWRAGRVRGDSGWTKGTTHRGTSMNCYNLCCIGCV